MKQLSVFITFFISFSFFNTLFLGMPLLSAGAVTGSVATESGLHIVTFDAPVGKVYVNLPDDMAMGDIIAGTLTARPAGKTEAEKAGNLDLLSKFIIEVGNNGFKLIDGWGKWQLPDTDKIAFVLKNPEGKVMGKVEVPVLDNPPAFTDAGFQCPEYAQAGLGLPVKGKFNGDFSDTQVTLDEKELERLAESPRQVIVKAPLDKIGSTILEFSEGDNRGSCRCRNIYVQLAAGKLHLKRGQTTGLSVTVRGLEGLEEPIPLKIENLSPRVIRLEGPDSLSIRREDVMAGGIFIYRTTVTAVSSGTFRVRASVPYPAVSSEQGFGEDSKQETDESSVEGQM